MNEGFLESLIGNDVRAVEDAIRLDPSLASARITHLGSTPLHFAAHRGFAGIVEVLLRQGADVHALENASGTTALHWAAEGGHEAIARELVSRGVDLEARDGWFALTPLGWATLVSWAPHYHADRPKCAAALRSLGASEDVFTAMHAGADAARGLLQFDSRAVEQRLGFAARAMQPLHVAAREGWSDRAEVLLVAGASVSETTSWGLTPMAVALLHESAVVAALLVDHGAHEDASVALVRGDYEKLASELKTLSPEHCTALLFSAATYERAEAIPLLVAAGADVHSTTRMLIGEVPAEARAIHVAALASDAAAVEALLTAGASVDGGDARCATPLHIAAGAGDVETVRVLLGRGGDRTRLDPVFSATPLAWAENAEQLATAELLREG